MKWHGWRLVSWIARWNYQNPALIQISNTQLYMWIENSITFFILFSVT